MVDLVVSRRVCDGGGGVSFSTQGVGRRTVVGRCSGGLLAAVGCSSPPAFGIFFFLTHLEVGWFL